MPTDLSYPQNIETKEWGSTAAEGTGRRRKLNGTCGGGISMKIRYSRQCRYTSEIKQHGYQLCVIKMFVKPEKETPPKVEPDEKA